MSRFFTQGETHAVESFLSAQRLGTFRKLTRSNSVEDAIELHQAAMNVGIAMMSVIGLVEIGLRNATCGQIESTFRQPSWLLDENPAFPFKRDESDSIKRAKKQAQRAAYAKLNAQEKKSLDETEGPSGTQFQTHSSKVSKRQRKIPVNNGQVVAQLTIRFWKRLYSDDYENILWRRCLKGVFPNKKLQRSDVSRHLEEIYQTRNRLAHFEPVFGQRLDDALSSIDFIIKNLGSRTPSMESVFAKLILPQRDILEGEVAIFKAAFERLRGDGTNYTNGNRS